MIHHPSIARVPWLIGSFTYARNRSQAAKTIAMFSDRWTEPWNYHYNRNCRFHCSCIVKLIPSYVRYERNNLQLTHGIPFNVFPVRNFGKIRKIFEHCCNTDTKYISKNCVASCSHDWLTTNKGSSYRDESNVRTTCAIMRVILKISQCPFPGSLPKIMVSKIIVW